MLRALSTRRSRRGYERLVADESAICLLEEKLKRSKTLPAAARTSFDLPTKLTSDSAFPQDAAAKVAKPAAARKVNKSHPLFSLFDCRRKKKTTAKPEFTRYLQYLREGGMWDVKSNTPVIYYK
ncbi:uncharacterized protein LOC8273376 [Ricinus communis]|uniref:Uncharacterized protein n=1 Tax=Ricinus communis TaxID=3988 RepID=B9S6D5_RICCO|nr:uncharacterized protein LOC8273376 [Ricinus communis]EEF40825.1 conserved hypothetical protein [Ricinus communis]|eukprot:XP_015576252.1 uncharacterized protein LOC8273376 [Ricinus communis]